MNLETMQKKQLTLKRFALLMVASILGCASLFAQSKTITGVITDSSGEAIIGASVTIKGTNAGTATDTDGKYSLTVSEGGKILHVSYIGMKSKEAPITGSVVDIKMEEDVSVLDEVVVIGYGTVKKKDLTGSVSSVGEKALKDIPVATAAEAITGKLPGVQVTTTEGSPDADIKIRVRGGGSITQSNTPLYIVDGFPMESISSIAPSEIQTIDVLKDASSTAIYGARGANGVVIITTKSAKEGKFSISYNAFLGYKKIAKTLDVLSPYEFAQSQYERAVWNDKVPGEYESYFGSYQDVDLYNYMTGTDWQNVAFGNTGSTFNQSISATGGSKQANYNINYNHIADDAIMMGSNYNRDNFSVKLNLEPLSWLKMNFNARYSDTKVKGGGANDVTTTEKSPSDARLKDAVIFQPIPIKNIVAQDDDAEAAANLHPPTETIPDNDREKKTKEFNLNGGISIIPIKNLTIRSEVGSNSNYGSDDRFYGLTTYYVTSGNAAYKNHPASEMNNTEYYSFRNTNTANYVMDDFIKNHNLSVMVGEEMISTKSKYLKTEVQNYPVDFDSQMAWKFTTQGIPVSTDNHYNTDDNLLSYFGRLNYDYMGRYLVSATFRADGSSKFAPGKQWGYFPSAAVAWRVTDENFMASTRNWLSNLKARLSFGTAGNNNIPADSYKQIYTSSSTTYLPASLSNSYWSAGTIMSNPDLRWETTITRNIGLDFGFLNNRINGAIEVYKNDTKDLLLDFPTSGSGYVSQMRNIGKTSNKGVEFSVNAVLVDTKDFSLNVGFNISANKNKVVDLGGLANIVGNEAWTSMTEASNSYRVFQGQPLGIMYGYVTDGMYAADDFTWNGAKWVAKSGVVDNSSITGLSWGPGALKLKDISGPDGVPDGKITDDDRTEIGNANPKHFGAFNLNATYKGFDFSANFNYVYGNDIYNANKIEFTSGYYKYRNRIVEGTPYTQVDRSTGAHVTDASALDALNQNANIWSAPTGRYVFHSWAVEDGSFIRLSSLTLGYTLPKNLLAKAYIQQLRFYVSGYNLYTWTNYSGYDPEVDTRRKTGLTPGVDYSAYPKSRTVNFGVNLTF